MIRIFSRALPDWALVSIFILIAGNSMSQSLLFKSNTFEVERAPTDIVLKIVVESKSKKKSIPVRVVDNKSGTAELGIDYKLMDPDNFTLSEDNRFQEVYRLKILSGAAIKKKKDIQLRFVFKNCETDEYVDSIITVFIKPKDKCPRYQFDSTNTFKTDFVQYTDFLGFSNDRPNGLLQQQFLFKWPIIRKHYSVSEKFKIQFLRSVLLPNLLFNRIEKSEGENNLLYPVSYTIKGIDSSGASQRDTTLSPVISSFDIMRYTSQKLEGRIVLVALFIGDARVHLQYAGSVIRNHIADSIVSKEKITRSLYSFSSGWSVYVKSTLDAKTRMNIEAELGFNRFYLRDNYFKQYDVYKLANDDKKAIAFPVGENYSKSQRPIYFGIVTLYKDWGKDSKNSAFFRIRYNYQDGRYKFYAKDRPGRVQEERFYNHFLQLQLGISLGMEKLFGG